MSQDHEFAQFLRTIGRGPHLSRPLERAEARQAMHLILEGRAEPVQLGAYLLVLRYRGETAAELAGMVEAARARFTGTPSGSPAEPIAELDWPSYADRHRQQPWFVLAARLLAENGIKVLMHGIAGYSQGYAPTRPALEVLGLRPAASLSEAAERIARENFAYIGLESFCAPLSKLFELRPLLGVRSAVNTLARALNPAGAPHQLQGVFHPPYRALHRDLAVLEGQPMAAIFKGGAGEVQRNPLKPCRVAWVRNGETAEENWPALLPGTAHKWREEPLGAERIAALWRGEIDLPAPEAAITGTVALALSALDRTEDMADAQAMAEAMWRARSKEKLDADAALGA
jgi:anthranilate phosphoribosyltransferase